MSLIPFPYFVALVRNRTILNISDKMYLCIILVLRDKTLSFTINYSNICQLWKFPSIATLPRFFSWMQSKHYLFFSESVKLIIYDFFPLLWIWWISLIDFQMLNPSFINKSKPTCSWCMIHLHIVRFYLLVFS